MILPDLKAAPAEDPGEIIRLRDSIYAADLFVTAVGHLNFFSLLYDSPLDFKSICAKLKVYPGPCDVMLTYFKSLDLIREESGIFMLSKKAEEFLIDSAERSLLPYISTQTERPVVEKMLGVLRTGEPAGWGAKKDELDWAKAMERDDFADMFTAGMDSRGAYFAPGLAGAFDFSGYSSILDVAGASGIYAAAIKAKYPEIRADIFEKSPVDLFARRALFKRGLKDKIGVISGDMFLDELPGGYDIHLYSHVLHDWGAGQSIKLIEKSYRSLNHGGIIMIHDAHLNEKKDGPLTVAEYSVLLMFSTYGKCYSVGEIGDMLIQTGFKDIKFMGTIGNRSIITGRKN
ncbi:MAG: methyltransferase [Spirochaetes bacterium]|nr:methyltransferase [Spirochaetota bacterium]